MRDIVLLTIVIILLILSITRFRVHPFVALLLSGIGLGLLTGASPIAVLEALLEGFASTLKWIGIVMILGTVIGEILYKTGAAYSISSSITNRLGEKRVPIAMGLTGYIVAIPVFVDVAYIMLQSITESIAVRSKRTIISVGLSLTAGLTATHALLPPTPGPLAAAGIMGANLGKVIWINIFIAFLVTLGGLLWASLYCRKVTIPYDRELSRRFEQTQTLPVNGPTISTLIALTPIFFPLVLIALGSFSGDGRDHLTARIVQFLGSPTIALFIGVFLAFLLLRKTKSGRLNQLSEIFDNSIQKASVVIMITGAGGAFGGVIKASTIGNSVSEGVLDLGIPGILFPFLLAAAMTTSTGSLTVSLVTTSSIVAPMTGVLNLSPEMAVALIGSGSFCVIHANSSFFWLFSRLHQVRPGVLLRTMTGQSLVMGLSGLLGVLVLRIMGVH
jgi:GntP family gluconate:H+ symporter